MKGAIAVSNDEEWRLDEDKRAVVRCAEIAADKQRMDAVNSALRNEVKTLTAAIGINGTGRAMPTLPINTPTFPLKFPSLTGGR